MGRKHQILKHLCAMKYKLTIITVCFNCKHKIKTTIENILNFVSEEVEYLIIDGGSHDGTLELIKAYSGKSHFRYISEPDNGIYNAMNKGASIAYGEWICYINCGDLLLKLPDLECNKNIDANCFAVDTEDGIIYPSYKWSIHLGNTLPHQGLFYRRSRFKGFEESYKIFADYALNIDMYESRYRIQTSNEVIAFHSLIGISNNKSSAKELKELLASKNTYPVFLLALFRFKLLGLKYRLNKILHG